MALLIRDSLGLSESGGVRGSVTQGVSGALGATGSGVSKIFVGVSPECQKGVGDTPGTLFGHFGARTPSRHPCGTLSWTPPLWGTLSGTLPGTLWAEGL